MFLGLRTRLLAAAILIFVTQLVAAPPDQKSAKDEKAEFARELDILRRTKPPEYLSLIHI